MLSVKKIREMYPKEEGEVYIGFKENPLNTGGQDTINSY